MKKIYLALTVFLTLTIYSFGINTFAADINDEIVIDSNIDKSTDIYTDLNNQAGIMTLSINSLDDNISVVNIYVDSSNILKAALIKCSQENYTDDIYIKIDGNNLLLDTSPESNGYIYQYFDTDLVLDESVEISFYNSDEETESVYKSPINIVTTDDNWITSENGHSLYLYEGASESITIPNFYNDKIITMVGGYTYNGNYENILFDNSVNLTDITVSEGIRAFNHFAFYDIDSLVSCNMPDTIEVIGAAAFADTSLTGNIVLPENLTALYSYAFMNCNKLTGDITIPGGVSLVDDYAFLYCTSLNGNLVFEDGVEEIGELVFSNCAFQSIALPETLIKIGPFAFQNCTKVKSLSLPEGLQVISDGAFNHMSGLTNTSLTIPSTVTTIGGDYEVDYNTGYGCHVFYDMGQNSTFVEFKVADGNEYFTAVDGVLYSIDVTRMIAYPRGKTDTEFEIPEGITQIDEMAFSRAYYLNKIILPDSFILTDIVPANVLNQLGNNLAVAIYCYTSINEIAVKDTNTNYCTVDGILYSADKKSLWYIPNQYSGDVVIEDGTERIEQGSTFIASKSNTKWTSVHIPSSMKYIGYVPFELLNEYFQNYITVDTGTYYKLNESTGQIVKITDANSDGNVDKADAAAVLKYISSIPIDSISFDERAADSNDDNVIDFNDVILILKNI